MRRLLPWGVAAAVLAACQTSPPAAPPSPPETQPQVPAPHPDAQTVSAPILFLQGPDAMVAGTTAKLLGRTMLPEGSELVALDVRAPDVQPTPKPLTPFGGGYSPATSQTYILQATARIPNPDAAKKPFDFELPFTPPTAGTYHLDMQGRRYSVMVSAARATSSWPRPTPNPSPSPMPELWGMLTPTAIAEDEPVLGSPGLVERPITAVQLPASARVLQRVQMTARFWTSGLGKTAVDAYVVGQQVRVTGLSMPDSRAVMGPIPQQVQVPFSVLFTEPGLYTVVSGTGEGSYGTINVY